MGGKKIYQYEKPQFVYESNKELFFLSETIAVSDELIIYTYETIFNDRRGSTSTQSEAKPTPIHDTYKNIVDLWGQFNDIGNRNTRGFSVTHRTEIINLCLNFGYKSIGERYRPTVDNLGEVFDIKYNTLLNMEKSYNISCKNDAEKNVRKQELVDFIARHIK